MAVPFVTNVITPGISPAYTCTYIRTRHARAHLYECTILLFPCTYVYACVHKVCETRDIVTAHLD